MAYVTVDAIVIPKWVISTTAATTTITTTGNISSNEQQQLTSTSDDISSLSDFSMVDNVKLVPIQKLREKFEHWLITTFGDLKGRSLIQQVLFLDEFYDPKSLQTRKLLNNEEIFHSLERFLNHIFKSEAERMKQVKENTVTDFPYLERFEEILSNQDHITIPQVLREHEGLNNLLKQRSKSLRGNSNNYNNNNHNNTNSSVITTIENLTVETSKNNNNSHNNITELFCNSNDVQLIVNMLSTIISYYFAIFQQYNTKIISKWMNEEINNCPTYLIDNIKKRLQKCNKYSKIEKLKDEDFNYRYIIDKDFEFGNYLSEFTTEWKISKKIDLQNKNFTSWKSKLNWTTLNDMKNQKIIGFLNCSLEDCVKVIGANSFINSADESVESCSLQEFKSIQTSNSLQKYATVIHTSLFNFGALFRKRSLENVVSAKCSFIGNELYTVSHLYKTCCHVLKVNNDEPLKIVCYGLRTFVKIDNNKILYFDVRLNNTKGMLNKIMSLAFNKIANASHELIENAIEEKRKEGFPKPNDEKDYLWMILRNYHQNYCKNVDNPLFK
ncbi:hypothetical protein ABK040_004951 [Willaertia magna]